MKGLEDWIGIGFGPLFVFGVVVATVVATAVAPPSIKRRLRTALFLCAGYGALVVIDRFVSEGHPLDKTVDAVASLLAALATARLAFVVIVDLGWEQGGKRPLNQLLRDVLQTVAYAVAAITALRTAGINATSLLATGTVVTAIVGLALQETLGNLAAGVAIQIDKPIELGDWVRLDKGDVIGRVVSTNWRSVTLQADDRLHVVVPNGHFSRTPFTNFSKPGGAFRRSIYFTIPYDVAPTRVHEAVLAACADTPDVLADPAPSILTWSFTDHGVQYWLRYFVGDFALRDRVHGELSTRIWFHLKRRKIDLAVPVRRSWIHEIDEESIATMHAEVVRDRRAAIDHVDFLAPLSSDAKDTLARRGSRKLFAPGETILRSGEHGREFYIVRRGLVAIRVDNREVARLGPGEFCGELALLTGRERQGNVIAVTETEVFEVDEHMFRDVLQGEPKIAEEVSRIVAERQAALESRESGVGPTPQAKSASVEILGKIKNLFGLD